MHPPRLKIANPLSFSVLDLVMGLVGVILLISFSLAVQPYRKSKQEVLDRYIKIETIGTPTGFGLGVAIKFDAKWITALDSSTNIRFDVPGFKTPSQLVWILKDQIKKGDRLVIYKASPPMQGLAIKWSTTYKTMKVKVYCGQKKRPEKELGQMTINQAKTIEIKKQCGWI